MTYLLQYIAVIIVFLLALFKEKITQSKKMRITYYVIMVISLILSLCTTYFSNKKSHDEKISLENNFTEVKNQIGELKISLEPFKLYAKKIYPTLEEKIALEELAKSLAFDTTKNYPYILGKWGFRNNVYMYDTVWNPINDSEGAYEYFNPVTKTKTFGIRDVR